MKKFFVLLMIILSCSLLNACKDKKAEKETETTVQIETETETQAIVVETEETEVFPEGQMRSYLTGEIISTDVGLKRPYAVMINNISEALPQSGISQAEVMFEAKVEGGITRLMALFQDTKDLSKLGSIRSARHYYIDFANEFEAIFVHYGQSKYAMARIEDDKIKTISGLSSYGEEVFYRTPERAAPHDVYTNQEMLEKGLGLAGVTRDYPEGYKARFKYNKEDTVPEQGEDAKRVDIPFDSNPYFEYDEASGMYLRYQYGRKHIDVENDKQLEFKNIIVQYVKEKTISDEDHQDLTLLGKGPGYYISDGKAVKIIWEKKQENGCTLYYTEDGEELRLNTGKTMFEFVPKDTRIDIKG